MQGLMWMIFLVCIGWWNSAVAVPTEVHIGGLFAPINGDGDFTLAQAEHLAAFVMAVNEINDKTDGMYDDLLPNTNLTFAIRGDQTMASSVANYLLLEESFNGTGPAGIINGLSNADALVISRISTSQGTPQILSVANHGEFDNYQSYPYVAKTVALESYQGVVVNNMICNYFKARKLVTFSSTSVEDLMLMEQFMDESNCTLDIMADISIRSEDVDFSVEIAEALTVGARYFVVFLPSFQLAPLLEQGYASNLFHENTVIITPNRGADNITTFFSADADIVSLMKGVFSLRYWPNYHMNRTSEAIEFVRRWRQQPSTEGQIVNGQLTCDQTKDDVGNSLYHRQFGSSVICTGLNFAAYNPSGADMLAYTSFTYDATVFLAMAIHLAVEHGMNYMNPVVVQNLLVDNASFVGASGPVDLFHGKVQYALSGRGNRNTGNVYVITNFNEEAYLSGVDHFVDVAYFEGDTKVFEPCGAGNDVCYEPVYSGAVHGDYSVPPADTPPPIEVVISANVTVALAALGSFCCLLVFIFAAFTVKFRRVKMIKTSQPILLYCVLFGGLLASGRVVTGGVRKSVDICIAEFWLGHLAFIIMISSLLVKAYRVHCIVNTKALRRVKFSAKDAFKLLLCIVFAGIVFIVFATVFGQPHLHVDHSVVANQDTTTEFCSLERAEFQTTLFALEFVLLLAAFWVCWETRNVPDIVNESKMICTGRFAALRCRLISYILSFLTVVFCSHVGDRHDFCVGDAYHIFSGLGTVRP
jgi:ABC-type branched-subunit amino acid transport system substrate-binding protein